MSNSPLISYTKISPNCTKRKGKICKITPHHMAGNCGIEALGDDFARPERKGSSNYGIGTDGRIAMYVPEDCRAWTSSNRDNDEVAVTIEVANDGGAPNWHVSDKALAALIDLCVDICQRNGIDKLVYTGDKTGNLTKHEWFANTTCPGPYLGGKFPYIAEEVNKRLHPETEDKVEDNVLYRVQVGAYSKKSNAENMLAKVKAAGFEDAFIAVSTITAPVEKPKSIQEGSKVKIKNGAKSYEGATMKSFVYAKVYTVDDLNGNRAVLDKSGICTAFNVKDLILQD